MPRTVLLQRRSRETDASPEFLDLVARTAAQARAALGELEVVSWSPEAGSPPSLPRGAGRVLLIGGPRVLVTAASLRAMEAALEAGAAVCVSRPVASLVGAGADLGAAAPDPIYTLRGFERWERLALAAPVQRTRSRAHLPVSLFRGDAFDTLAAEIGEERLLQDRAALAGRDDVAVAGVHHEFTDYYGEVRDDVLEYLPGGCRDVLEVGCARGLTGERIQQELGCRVTGLELHPEVAEEARRRLHRVIVGDAQTRDLAGPWDAIVATELFEHLTDPMAFVRRALERLRPGGRLVLSVPNVGHWSVVDDLLAGRWDYLPIGLLCFTHFRFFTRTTLEEWFARLPSARTRIVAQTTELPERFAELPPGFDVDRESLATKGFYVLVESSRAGER